MKAIIDLNVRFWVGRLMTGLRSVVAHEAFQIFCVLAYAVTIISLSCIYETLAFAGGGMIAAVILLPVLHALDSNND